MKVRVTWSTEIREDYSATVELDARQAERLETLMRDQGSTAPEALQELFDWELDGVLANLETPDTMRYASVENRELDSASIEDGAR